MKKFLYVAIMIMIVGCGGGSGLDLPTINNATKTDTSNQYGYFGESVIFGEYLAAQTWYIINPQTNESISLTLSKDGDMDLYDGSGHYYSDYGVSRDGIVIRSNMLNDLTIIGIKYNYKQQVDADGSLEYLNCYDISGGDRPLIMCP